MNATHNRSSAVYHGTFLLHIIFIFAAFLSPLFLNWRWVLVGVICYYLQIRLLGGCALTKFQFKGTQNSFYSYYLKKLGLQVNERALSFLARHGFPWLIFLIAYLHQA